MPLRCVDEHGRTIEASACNDEEWEALRARSRGEHHLRMPCCPARAVLKTSRLGTRFFAHKAKGACTWKPETEVHRYLKDLALNAARESGWNAETESSGSTPGGEQWIADVLAWRGDEKVAVEIQWSAQTNEKTLQREERYRRSGVTGVWLLRQPGFPISEDLPAVCIGGGLDEGMKILVPKSEQVSAQHREKHEHWGEILAPEAFMAALFEGRFRFGIRHATHAHISIAASLRPCKNGTAYITNQCKWTVPPATLEEATFTINVGPHRLETTANLGGTPSGLDEQIRDRICSPNRYVGRGQKRRRKFIRCERCRRTVAWVTKSEHEIHKVLNYELNDSGETMFAQWTGSKEMLRKLDRWAVWES